MLESSLALILIAVAVQGQENGRRRQCDHRRRIRRRVAGANFRFADMGLGD